MPDDISPPAEPAPRAGLSDAEVDALCTTHGNRQDELLEILHAVQARVGWLPEPVLQRIARRINISRADIHGVVSFYHDFHRAPIGRHTVQICQAEACQAVGAAILTEAAEKAAGCKLHQTSADGAVTLLPTYCLGNCALGPAIMVDGKLHGRVSVGQVTSLIATARGKERR